MMERRKFLRNAAVLAGGSIARSALAAPDDPCPPDIQGAQANQCGDQLIDWQARSSGPGVVWAHRFQSEQDVQRFLVAGDQNAARAKNLFVQDDGIMGDGCLSQVTPKGDVHNGSWGRPMGPIPGDINNAGLRLSPAMSTGTETTSVFVNMKGGHFGHQDYHSGNGSPRPQDFIATDFYLQYRVKFSPGRFDAAEPSGKSLMLVTNYETPKQEIVTQALTSWGGGYYRMYTNVGTGWNWGLTDPQGTPGGSSIQPNGAFDSTCKIGEGDLGQAFNNCWCFPDGEWATILIHVIPGHQKVSGNLNDPANPRDTGIEVWTDWDHVNNRKQNSYIKIWEMLEYQWDFEANYFDQSPQPWGWNWLNFTAFNGGAAQTPSVNGYYHRFDQIVFSTEFIPCPQA